MARKEKASLASVFSGLKNSIQTNVAAEVRRIPSIIEFVESPDYLGLPHSQTNPITLFPAQRIMLKAFYRGSEGNENVEFDSDEIDYLRSIGLDKEMPDYNDRGDVVGKIAGTAIFRELVLVWGRGSGKDFFVSLIALYEAMKLLETPSGDPYAKYRLPRGSNPITILTIATAAPQAEIAFREIRGKLLQSKYFQGKFIPEGLGASTVHLLTPLDRIENELRKKKGQKPDKGGIVIRAGHSNSDSLLGIQCYVLLLDEVASFGKTDGASGGHRIYEAMLPSLNRFVRNIPILDDYGQQIMEEDGKPKVTQVFDSKVVSISSPRGKEGILYDMFSKADEHNDRLVCRLPTWIVNLKLRRESLRKLYQGFSEESFMMEFGAEFSATAGMNFFVEERVEACIDRGRSFRTEGMAGVVYFAHLDPATTNNNYALAIVHKELFLNPILKRAEFIVVLDHLKVWSPTFDGKKVQPVMVSQVEEYLMRMNRVFRIGLTTYDQFNSISTLASLKKIGMPCKLTHYSKPYKMEIYTELEKLINEKRLVLPYDDLLNSEMKNLQRRYDTGRGFSVTPNKEADCKTDDCCDALAGAVYNCLATTQSKLPQAKLASMPSMASGGMRQWNSMSGTMGYGSGQQIARLMRGGGSGPNITAT